MQVAIKEAHRRPAMLDSTSFLILSIVFFYVKRAVETVAVPRFRPFLVAAFLWAQVALNRNQVFQQ